MNRLAFQLLLMSMLAAGCGGGSGDVRELPDLGSKTLTFYGRVNEFAWADGAPVEEAAKLLHSEIKAMAASGWDGYQIELWGWVNHVGATPEEGIERIRAIYPKLVQWCREEGMWLFVCGANDNQHLGKYGSEARRLSQDGDQIAECLKIVAECGSDNVIVQPVGETQTPEGRHVEIEWANDLGSLGFYLVNNNGSRPHGKKTWSDAYCVHVWSMEDAEDFDPEAWVNNDTHSAIIEMSADGTDHGPCNPEAVSEYVSAARSDNRAAVMVYAFGFSGTDGLDLATIGAIE